MSREIQIVHRPTKRKNDLALDVNTFIESHLALFQLEENSISLHSLNFKNTSHKQSLTPNALTASLMFFPLDIIHKHISYY